MIKLKTDSECTPEEIAGLPEIESLLNQILSTKYADAFWFNQWPDCNPDKLHGSEILKLLREDVELVVNYYSDDDSDDENVDGFEEPDDMVPTVHLHREAIIEFEFTNQDKASLILHERSHSPNCNFFHDGNLASGNENTIPYLCNKMVDNWNGEK